ncbi:GUP1 protein [Uncinocarpus reesii 1704]|uniref:GUP1 protein n=1 Tax=Uncinocarpus reesii (strain UAMH 1704) TaxID=336963 RepID=C4JFI9_UNCRE|nr:GUP1 protein [Uncinocarpus reesii 1704]EEP76154.1 GUP1 protein [Uncinocarpus reesii 1704]
MEAQGSKSWILANQVPRLRQSDWPIRTASIHLCQRAQGNLRSGATSRRRDLEQQSFSFTDVDAKMSLLTWLRRLYSLDILDTRFTVSATTPPNLAASQNHTRTQDAATSKQPKNGASPPRWNTPEFYIYYVVFIVAVPLMFKTAIDVSQESHPTYSKYSELLSPGWIPGRKVDNSDAQYASFRDNVRYMAILVVFHPLLRRLYNILFPCKSSVSSSSKGNFASGQTAAAARSRFEQRVSFDYWFSLVFLAVLHGFSALKVLGILFINFNIAKRFPRSYIPAATWIFNIGILFANELLHGYKYTSIATSIGSALGLGDDGNLLTWGKWLDSWGGLVSRWEVLFNITVLRLISFNLDYYWSLDNRAGSPVEKKQLDPSNLSERDRIATPADPAYFNLRNYFSYALYSPLYLAGPILTFNDYIHQQHYQLHSISKIRTLLYGIRFLLTLLCMELILHYIYVVAISKSSPDWSVYTPFQLSMLGYFNLHIIWLKLLIPWRFFRLWALIDGIDPPENMLAPLIQSMGGTIPLCSTWGQPKRKQSQSSRI